MPCVEAGVPACCICCGVCGCPYPFSQRLPLPRGRSRSPRVACFVTALARYTTGKHADRGSIAAAVTPFGSGRVGLCGPHPEAPPAWFQAAGLSEVGPTRDLGDDLVAILMEA